MLTHGTWQLKRRQRAVRQHKYYSTQAELSRRTSTRKRPNRTYKIKRHSPCNYLTLTKESNQRIEKKETKTEMNQKHHIFPHRARHLRLVTWVGGGSKLSRGHDAVVLDNSLRDGRTADATVAELCAESCTFFAVQGELELGEGNHM